MYSSKIYASIPVLSAAAYSAEAIPWLFLQTYTAQKDSVHHVYETFYIYKTTVRWDAVVVNDNQLPPVSLDETFSQTCSWYSSTQRASSGVRSVTSINLACCSQYVNLCAVPHLVGLFILSILVRRGVFGENLATTQKTSDIITYKLNTPHQCTYRICEFLETNHLQRSKCDGLER